MDIYILEASPYPDVFRHNHDNMNTSNRLKWLYYWIWYSYVARMLAHWGRDKMTAILPTTLSNKFSWMEMLEYRLKFHWSLFLRVQFIIYHHWFGRRQAIIWTKDGYPDSKFLSAPDGPHDGPMNLAIRVDYRRVYPSLGRNELKVDWNGNPVIFMTNNFRIWLSPPGLPGIKQLTWKHWSLGARLPSECFITHAIKEMADAKLTNKCGCEIFFILIHCVIQ